MSPSRSRRRIPRKKKSSNTKLILLVSVAVVALIIVGYVMLGNNSSSDEEIPTGNKIKLETSVGDILIELRDDMPITTANFKNLVQQGVYDGTKFHRVIADFMIQGGDASTGSWSGGSIPNIQDEFSDNQENKKNIRGTIAMANAGPNTGNSQFFINVVNNSDEIFDESYPVFGDVIQGMDIVDTISIVDTDGNPPVGANKPLEDVTLIKATFVD